jgi:hypothetical protein
MNCTICERPTKFFQTGQLLGRHQVDYWHCPHCGSIGTESPFWLPEAYDARAITSTDVGLVCRNLELSRITSVILRYCYPTNSQFLDYGGGYGLLVRLMRDRGYNFHWQDEYCGNLFAVNWVASPDVQYELLTAFEVMEHLPKPIETIAAMFQQAPNILFSTELIPNPTPDLAAWDYYGLEHGQHVTLYTTTALKHLAQRWNKYFYSNGQNLHLFSHKPLNWFQQQILKNRRLTQLLDYSSRRVSLLPQDYQVAIKSTQFPVHSKE